MPLIPSHITESHDIAQLDLPLPQRLDTHEDSYDWGGYAREIPPGVLLLKLAEAADAWIRKAPRALNASHMTDDDKVEWGVCWEVVLVLAIEAEQRFAFSLDPNVPDPFKSDLDRGLFFVESFFEKAGNPAAAEWKQRRAYANAVHDDKVDALIQDSQDVLFKLRDGKYQALSDPMDPAGASDLPDNPDDPSSNPPPRGPSPSP